MSTTNLPDDAGSDSTPAYEEEVELVGHIIDSLLLPKVLDEIMTLGGRFEMDDVRTGQTRVSRGCT
jgi:hypothetical protein